MSIQQIDTNRIQNDVHESHRGDRRSEPTDNSQLMVPASYAAVGGTFELLMLMLEASKVQKDSARELRGATEVQLAQVQAGQVEDIRSKAKGQLVGAAVGASLTIGASSASLGSSMQELKASDLQGRADSTLARAKADGAIGDDWNAAEASAKGLREQATSARTDAVHLSASAKGLDAAGMAAKAGFDAAATNKDADATEKQHRADALKRSSERLGSELDILKGNEDKLISYARDIEAAKNRCTQIAMQSR